MAKTVRGGGGGGRRLGHNWCSSVVGYVQVILSVEWDGSTTMYIHNMIMMAAYYYIKYIYWTKSCAAFHSLLSGDVAHVELYKCIQIEPTCCITITVLGSGAEVVKIIII